MLHFPQLESGAPGQFPSLKRAMRRTVVNAQADGSTRKYGDPAGTRVEWRLAYEGLTDAEMQAIEGVFQATEGRLGSFTFLDPSDNLLAWSEKLTADVWARGPLVEVVEGIADPLGTTRAARITNTAQAAECVEQTLEAPAQLQYCLSLYMRSDYEGESTVYQTDGTASERRTCTVGPAWVRIALPGKLASTAETVTFGVELAAGRTVDVFGMQVEAQAGASKYKPTLARGGVYREAHFGDDTLAVTTDGSNRHSCRLRVEAGWGD